MSADRLVAFAYTQLHLARRLTADRRLPWEKHQPHDRISPRRVRRGFRQATANLPTPLTRRNPPAPAPHPTKPLSPAPRVTLGTMDESGGGPVLRGVGGRRRG
jgi:hypothetical protein